MERANSEQIKNIKKADDLLKLLGLDSATAPVKLMPILEKLGIDLKTGKLIYKNEEISGAIKKKETGATILVNSTETLGRQRFTIAHEIAHYIFEMVQGREETILETRSYRHDGVSKEFRADSFAADLLMPKELLEKEYNSLFFPTSIELSEKFGVSKMAMKKRLKGLGLFTYD